MTMPLQKFLICSFGAAALAGCGNLSAAMPPELRSNVLTTTDIGSIRFTERRPDSRGASCFEAAVLAPGSETLALRNLHHGEPSMTKAFSCVSAGTIAPTPRGKTTFATIAFPGEHGPQPLYAIQPGGRPDVSCMFMNAAPSPHLVCRVSDPVQFTF